MVRTLRLLVAPALVACCLAPFAVVRGDDAPPPPPPVPTPLPDPAPAPGGDDLIEGTLVRDPADVYEFDAGIGDDTTAAEVCQMFADTIDGTRHPVSEIVHMKKQPKVGDKVKINWNTPKVKIVIEGKVTAINDDGLATVNVTKITGEYKDVVAGLERNQDWSVLMDWP
jgi:hypothetical protein